MCGVRDENIELAERLHRRFDQIVAKRRLRQASFDEHAFAPMRLDGASRFLRIGPFRRKMRDNHVGAFARKQHCHSAADSGISAGDQRHLAGQLAGRTIFVGLKARPRRHLRFDAGLFQMLFGKRRRRLGLLRVRRLRFFLLDFGTHWLMLLGVMTSLHSTARHRFRARVIAASNVQKRLKKIHAVRLRSERCVSQFSDVAAMERIMLMRDCPSSR